ncbi:MAG: SCO family protein [Acidobacteria bacterium]|nr:SCO family protein [Acidobacteriota bacterium]
MRRALPVLLLLMSAAPISAQIFPRSAVDGVQLVQRIDSEIPLDLELVDESGKTVRLQDYFDKGKPVVLTPVYYSCPMLCNLVLDGMVNVARELRFDIGEEYEVVTVSFDDRETADMAAAKKEIYARRYGRAEVENGWHFLTGDKVTIRQLMDSIGFGFAYDDALDQYAHSAVVVVLTPEGKIARYFYGFEFKARDLRLAIVEASEGRVGTIVDQAMLVCFSYDASVGRYTPAVMRGLQVAGSATVLILGGFVFSLIRKERKNRDSNLAG